MMPSSTFFLQLAWSRQLAHTSTDAANALWQSIRRVHGVPAALPEVSAEAAGAAARRSVPLLRLPANLELELETVLADRGVKPKEARRLGQELTERLKSLSHTPQRGGFGAAASAKAAPPDRGGRLRGAELLAAREAFEAGELLSMDDRAVNAALGLPPPLRDDQRHAPQMQKLVPKYKTEAEVVAYVVARMAPEYAVCRRVLDEAVRLLQAAGAEAEAAPVDRAEAAAPAAGARWRPREALVHGAGVGAAVLAALEACAASPTLTRILALEPSSLRQMLGSRVEKAHRAQLQQQRQQQQQQGEEGVAVQAHDDWRVRKQQQQQAVGPVVSWVQALPPLSKAASAQRRRYDLVIAPYQLTALPTVEERQRLVRELWDRCGDVLVLVEPGTPRGFAAIAEARELILGREGRKRAQLQMAAVGSSWGPHHGEGGAAADPRVVGKLKGTGAHVVAPCPHDGTCPMLASKRNWCHFSQPLLLPGFMQQAMVAPADKGAVRGRALNVQDERFSYVILRRGPRPSLRVAVAREYESAGGGPDGGGGGRGAAAPAAPPMMPSRLPPRVVLSQVSLNRAAAAAATAAGTATTPDGPTAATAATAVAPGAAGPLFGHSGAGGDAGQRPAPRRAPLFSPAQPQEDAAPAPANFGGAAAESEALSVGGRPGGGLSVGAGAGVRAGGAAPATAAFTRKYPAFGTGLVGRLIAMQDAGVDWAAAAEDQAEQHDDDDDEAPGVARAATVAGPEAETSGAAAWNRDAGGGDGGSSSGGGSAGSPGLDAAVAELSLSIFGSAPVQATADPRVSHTSAGLLHGASFDAPPSLPPPEAAHLPAVPTAAIAACRALGGVGASGAREEVEVVPEPDQGYDGGGGVRQQQLTRDDVSDDEYDRAERQLVERIYGPEAAHAWLAALGESDGYRDEYLEEEGPEQTPPLGEMAARRGMRSDEWEEAGEGEGEELEMAAGLTEGWDQASPAAAAACRFAEASSYGWGRLVRSPRLRGGHAILDMCVGPQHHYPDHGVRDGDSSGSSSSLDEGAAVDAVATDAMAAGGGGATASGSETASPAPARPEGRLVQQVVAKSARRGWMGGPAYRLARRLSWGDVWPDWYIRSHNAREATAQAPPHAGAGPVALEPRLGGRK